MRGLDTRVLLANTRIMMFIDPEKANSMMDAVERLAEQDGWKDAENGFHTLPLMFDGETELIACWELGQARFTIGFDEARWHEQCMQMVKDSNQYCGLSFDFFVDRLSSAVDRALLAIPERYHNAALEIAQEYGYATASEREEVARSNADDGYCAHGIELGCCPAGCDFPDVWDDTLDYRADIDLDDGDVDASHAVEGKL